MKKRVLSLLLAMVMALSLCAPALAAEAAPVSVQLDGKTLDLAKVAPKVMNQRTYLPFRAVFEAMDVTVDYEEGTKAIVASRDGKTMKMVIGATEATITELGKTTTVPVANPAFAEDGVTYVPVRFAAETFGCNVGWDQETGTAVIVDVPKLVSDKMSKGQADRFGLMGKLTQCSAKHALGTWALDGTLEESATLGGQKVLTMKAPFTGTAMNQHALAMKAKIDLDMTGLTGLAAMLPQTNPMAPLAKLPAKLAGDVDLRMNQEAGQLYLNLGDALNEQLKLEKGTWLSMDPEDLDLDEIADLDLEDLLESALTTVSLDGKSASGYAELVAELDTLADSFADSAFTKKDNHYTTTIVLTRQGVGLNVTLDLTTNQSGTAVTDYTVTATGSADLLALLKGEAVAKLGVDKVDFTAKTGMDVKGTQTRQFNITAGTTFSADVSVTTHYQKTATVPMVTLPEGAKVVDVNKLMNTPEKGDGTATAEKTDDVTLNITVTGKDGKKVTKAYTAEADNLGDFLEDAKIVVSEVGPYGRFITTVNGYKVDAAKNEWWCITKGGKEVATGADTTPIANGDTFELTLSTY